MAQFNPSEPCTVGCEWFPTREDGARLDGPFRSAGARLIADTTDNVAQAWITVESSGGAGWFLMEVFDLTDTPLPESWPDLTSTNYRPGSDVVNEGAYGFGAYAPAGSSVDVWRAVNAPTLVPTFFTPNSNQPVAGPFAYSLFGESFRYVAGLAGLSGSLAGEVINRVTMWTCVNVYPSLDPSLVSATFRPYLYIDGATYTADVVKTVTEPSAGGYLIRSDWYVNPATALPWTDTDLDAFDTTGTDGIGVLVDATGSANVLSAVHQMWMEVESCPGPDIRLAVGRLPIPNDAFPLVRQGKLNIGMRDPATGLDTSFNLQVGHEYLFTLRQTLGDVWMAWRRLDTGETLPGPPFWTSCTPELYRPTLRIAKVGEQETAAFMMALQDIFTAFSVDSQPYSSINGDISVELGLNQPWTRVYDTLGNFEQEITPSGTGDYDWLRILVRAETGSVTGDLTVQLRRRDNNAAVGSLVTITADDLDAALPAARWQTVEKRLDTAAALTAATQYYFDIESTTDEAHPWGVQVLSAVDAYLPAGLNNFAPDSDWIATFGGTVDQLTIAGTSHPQLDAAVTIADSPAAPTGLAALAVEDSCCVPFVDVTWDPTAISECGLSFLRYDLDRSVDGGVTWQRIAEITDEAAAAIEDHEAPSATAVQYRLRVVRSDQAASPWSDEVSVTSPTLCQGWTFTSNSAPTSGLWYADVSDDGTPPPRSNEFIDERETYRPLGRPYSVEIRELEDRGSTTRMKLQVRAGRDGCPDSSTCVEWSLCGGDVFGPLRDLSRAGLPYLCARNECGETRYVSLRVERGTWFKTGNVYLAEVSMIDVAAVPYPVDAQEPAS